jgi:hypothetical protein
MNIIRTESLQATITIGLELGYTKEVYSKDLLIKELQAYQQKRIDAAGIYLSASVSECSIVLSGQKEPHLKLEFINYPKFPLDVEVFKKEIVDLGAYLLDKMQQNRTVVESLFGLIEGSANGLEEAIKDDFLLDFNLVPEKLEVKGIDKFIKKADGYDIWIGTMIVNLIIDGEEFNVTRNWEEEYYIDKKHPDYKTDQDFYDSHKPYSSKMYREIMKSLEG